MKSLSLLNNLKVRLKNCTSCSKMLKSRQEVMGEDHYPCFFNGTTNAGIMLVGIAPGRMQNKDGVTEHAFRQGSGKILKKIFMDLDIDINNIFITNIVKCNTPADGKLEKDDIRTCVNNFLKNEIDLIKPKKIILLGNKATQSFYKYMNVSANVCTVWHPAAVMRGFKRYSDYIKQFRSILCK